MAEKVCRLGIVREDGYLYYIKTGAVWRSRKPKPPGEVAERVADPGLTQDNAYIYFLDPEGDISRRPRESPEAPAAAPVGAPVTFDDAFAPLAAHAGRAVFLTLAEKSPGLAKGRHAITVFDWSKLDADERASFAEEHLLTLAGTVGRGWAEKLVPFAMIGGESHPVPPDELDQQCDGVLLVDLRTGAVVNCAEATDSTARMVAPSTSALDLTSKRGSKSR